MLLLAMLPSLCAACGTFVTHGVSAVTPQEIVELRCYARWYLVYIEECHITSVDGQRPGIGQFANLGAELTPGRHWVEFEIERYLGGAGGTTQVCAFEYDFTGGSRYRIVAHTLEPDADWIRQPGGRLHGATIEIQHTPPGGEVSTGRLAIVCAPSGSLCRTTADCQPHPDMTCRMEEGHPYGTCSLRDQRIGSMSPCKPPSGSSGGSRPLS